VARTEGILAAVESAHAVAALPEVLARIAGDTGGGPRPVGGTGAGPLLAGSGVGGGSADARSSVGGGSADAGSPTLPREAVVVLGLSGRGDKDLAALGLKEGAR
jgi:hypothetical protein